MTKGNKIKTGMVLTKEGVEAYRELAKYLKAKYGKYRGLISHEVSKAIQFYLQHLKTSEGTPQSPQPQLSVTVEKAKESKPIERRETAKDLEQKVEGLTKRVEDLESLKQKVEDLSKEVKATEDTVKSITNALSNIDGRVDSHIKQRIDQILKTILPKIKETIEEEIDKNCLFLCGPKGERTEAVAEKLINHMVFCEDCQEGFKHIIGPILTKYKDEIKAEVLKAIKEEQEKEKKGGLFS